VTGDEAPAQILTFGEGALLACWGDDVTRGTAHRSQVLAAEIERIRAGDPRWHAPIAGAASVLVPFDPLLLDAAEAASTLRTLVATAGGPGNAAVLDPVAATALHEIPVAFGGADGPDLDPVAAELGIDADTVVRRLTSVPVEVLFLGFAPGFAYLGPLDDGLVVPRLATPRARVPAGSVAIAGRFAGIYPGDSPGGWRVLGRTPVRLFDPAADPPALLRPGDRVRLVPR